MANTHVKDCTVYVFFHEFHGLGFYIQTFNPYWVDLCVWYKIVVQFNSFACSCQVFPTPFIEEILFHTVCSMHLCNKLIAHICVGLCLGRQFCPMDLYVFRSIQGILIYTTLQFKFEIRKYDISRFVLFFPEFLWFHINLKIFLFYFCEKLLQGFQ